MKSIIQKMLFVFIFLQCTACGYIGNAQTSATMLLNYSAQNLQNISELEKFEAQKKHLLMTDIHIKARSYAIINKTFFVLSVIAAIAVFLWPSLSVVFKQKLDKWEWLKSATVQTTVTAIAALMFAFYTQYKDKQTSAESLMRYVIFSDKSANELAIKVSDELMSIDRGFSFNSFIDGALLDKPAQ